MTEQQGAAAAEPTVNLNSTWTLWFDNPRLADPEKDWKDNLTNCGSFDTVEKFWRVFNNLKPASQLAVNSNYHVFREGVIPMWEDPTNKEGGKFVLTIPKKDSRSGKCDEWWLFTVLSIIGETLDMDGDEVCGAVVSIRKNQDRIALWLKSSDQGRCTQIGARWKKCLEMHKTILKFQEHKAGKKDYNVCFSVICELVYMVFLMVSPKSSSLPTAAASGRSFRNESTFEV
jgi:translation initiation factor 4E